MIGSRQTVRRFAVLLGITAVAAVLLAGGPGRGQPAGPRDAGTFAGQIAALSEPGGYFDTDNLISNERSYLHVIPALRRAEVRGGAYIGVGPDTSFSYMAAVRPSIAFIVDIRRDNLLLHLLLKALFSLSSTRAEYLAALLGRTAPAFGDARTAPIDRLVAHLDASPPPSATERAALQARVRRAVAATGVTLSAADHAAIDRFHAAFMDAGLDLRFTSTGRAPQAHYPTYRELLLETDGEGRRASYLASEESFGWVKSLQGRDLVIPVVGDLAGPSALAAVGRAIAARGLRLSALYASNVEFYLRRQGRMPQFVANVRGIPRTRNSVIIRSVFSGYGGAGGRGSISEVQPIEQLVDTR